MPDDDRPKPEAPRRPGRPRTPQAGRTVTTYLTVAHVDRLIALAAAQRRSVSAVIREAVRRHLPHIGKPGV